MNPMDTLIWLVNFPASHGYAMVFIAGFSILGLFALSARGAMPGGELRAIREREGLLRADQRPRGRVGEESRASARASSLSSCSPAW